MKKLIVLFTIAGLFLTSCGGNDSTVTESETCTVTFDADNGSANTTVTVTEGGTLSEPAIPTKANDRAGLFEGTPPDSYTFDGWYNGNAKWDFASGIVSENITLTAQWTAPATIDLADADGNNIVEKTVSHVNANPGKEYTLVLDADVPGVKPQTLDQDDTALTITSVDTSERKISLGSTNGSLFSVGGTYDSTDINNILQYKHNTKLVIDGHVTLVGRDDNDSPLVSVYYGGSLDLKGYVKLTGNKGNVAGGIRATGESDTGWDVTITMSGNAEISRNTATQISSSGGVNLAGYVTFTMSGNAVIRHNTAFRVGGGVGVTGNDSTFIMNGGEISHNTASDNGGGVVIAGGATLTVTSDDVLLGIHDNTATNGPQVYVGTNGTFTVGGEDRDSF